MKAATVLNRSDRDSVGRNRLLKLCPVHVFTRMVTASGPSTGSDGRASRVIREEDDDDKEEEEDMVDVD